MRLRVAGELFGLLFGPVDFLAFLRLARSCFLEMGLGICVSLWRWSYRGAVELF